MKTTFGMAMLASGLTPMAMDMETIAVVQMATIAHSKQEPHSRGNNQGCPDSDFDGYADIEDEFPTNSHNMSILMEMDMEITTPWSISSRPLPFDPTRNIADVELSCSPTTIEVDLPSGELFSFTCTVESDMTVPFVVTVRGLPPRK